MYIPFFHFCSLFFRAVEAEIFNAVILFHGFNILLDYFETRESKLAFNQIYYIIITIIITFF